MDTGDRCCMDQNSNNICDMDEEEPVVPVEQQVVEVVEENPQLVDPVEVEPEEVKPPVASDTKEYAEEKLSDITDTVGDFVEVVRSEETVIMFDSSRSTGAMVTAALNLKLFLNDPDRITYADNANFDMLSKGEIDSLLKKNLILLGNGCTNDFILQIEGGSECDAGLVKGTGVIRTLEKDTSSVTLILGKDDEDVYFLVKKIIAGEVDYTSSMIEVDLS